MDKTWPYLKERFLSHRLHADYDAIVDAASDASNRLKNQVTHRHFRSATIRGYQRSKLESAVSRVDLPRFRGAVVCALVL